MAEDQQIQQPPDKIKKVYEVVSKKYDVGTLDQFRNDMKDPNKNKKVFDVVSKEYNVGDYNTFQKDLGLNVKKKEDTNGSPSLSASTPTQPKTGQSINTSESEQPKKELSNNYKNNTLTPEDISYKPAEVGFNGLRPGEITSSINNKGSNLKKWSDAPSDNYISALVNQHQDLQRRKYVLEKKLRDANLKDTPQNDLKNISDQESYLRTEIQKNYDSKKQKIVPELINGIKSTLGIDNWTDIDVLKGHLKWTPQSNKLSPESVQWIASYVDKEMNKRKDATINAQVSGDLDDKKRTYQDLTKSVVDYLNTIPIQKEQKKFTEEYISKNPQIKDAFNANQKINDYFSKSNVEAVKAKVNVNRDKEFVNTEQKYFGDGGIFNRNQEYVKIMHTYADRVHSGTMTDAIARKQIMAEIKQNPALNKINDTYESEIRRINEQTQKEFGDYIISGLKKDNPQLTVYKDGSVGVASLSEDQYKNMVEGYEEGLNDITKRMGTESEASYMKQANEKAKRVGAFWGSVGTSLNDLSSAFSKFMFNKTQWGGNKVRYYEAQQIASPQISQSQVADTWNWKGLESLKDPNFWLSKTGAMVPVIAGAGAVGAVTEGEGIPSYVSWLANAGLFTAQSGLSTYNQLLNTRDAQGNLLTESDASHYMSDQMEKDFLPNLLMMAVTSGTLLKAKNIAKPSMLGTAVKGIGGAAAAQPFFTWQGYNDYASFQEAQGKKADFWDYMQSKEFKDNLINGMVVGGGLSLLHTPGQYMKSVDNWTKLVHSSEGEFKNLIPQNYALGQEMAGNGNYLRDALKLHIFNTDPEGLNEEGKRQLVDLKNSLIYSTNLDKNIRNGNFDRNNIHDLYQAHNLSLADQNDHLSEQAAKEGNNNLANIYKDKAKDYREQAKTAANGEAKYHYLVNEEGHPIFISDNSFKTLEKDSKIAQWIKDGTIEGIHSSEDKDFAQRYKDFVGAKDESIVEGRDIMEQAKSLIEENKDKLGVYYAVAKDNPEVFYKEVADQAYGINATGDKSNIENAEKSAREQYGDDIVDTAKILYPNKNENIRVGDKVQWTSQGSDQFEEPKEITKISEDGKYVFVEGSDTGIPINQVIKKGDNDATTESQRQKRESDQQTDGQEYSRTGAPREEEPESQADRSNRGKDSKGQEITPEDNITVSEMLDKKGIYKGQRGTFSQDGQAVIFKVDNNNREYELGNVNEVGDRSLKDFGIEQESSVVSSNESGNVVVRGKEYLNKYSDPLQAINSDKEGNIVSVTLDTPDGQKRTFRGPVAEDIAYQIHLKQISDNNEQSELEQFINSDEKSREAIENGRPTEAIASGTDENTESVQREKIEPKEAVTISSPIKSEQDEKSTNDASRSQGEKGSGDGKGESEGGRQEGGTGDKKGVTDEGGAGPVKPPVPPSLPREPKETPKEEFTANRKDKNKEIEGAKELFEKQSVIPWTENFSNALSDVMGMYPDKSWYEALKNRVGHFVGLLDNNILFNPTSRDHASFLLFKHETLRQMGEIEGWDSPDDIQRQLADIKFRELQTDLFNTVRVTNPGGETGRALQILQAEIGGDVQNGLKIRRMELARAKGEPLNKEELASSAEDWEEEKVRIYKENELKLEAQQEKFDKQMAKLKGEKPAKLNKEKATKIASSLRGIADKVENFLKADLPEGTQRMGVDLQKKVADAIRWIADKIENGDIRIPDIISAAIEKFKGEKDAIELTNNIHNRLIEAGLDEKTIKSATNRELSLNKIKDLAATEGSTDITNSMVAKNLIRDYIKSHIGLTESKDIIGKATAELKKILPDVDENQIRKAYLKEDEFRQPTKKQLENGFKESERNFNSLTKLEKDIADLKEKQTLFKRKSKKSPTPYDKDIASKEKEKNDIMNTLGIKTSSEDKYTKASYDLRAKSHNQRLDNLVNGIKNKLEKEDLTEGQKKQLLNLKGKLENSKINLNPDSAESQEKTLKGALDTVKSVTSEFVRNSDKDILKLGDIRRGLQKIIDGFDADKNESTQNIKLQRAKDQAKRQMNEFKRKSAAGEFEDNPIVELTKSDAELIKAIRDRNKEQQTFEDKKKRYQKQRKDWAKKTGDFLRAAEVGYLIGNPYTIAKVGASALLRPQLEALTKLGYRYTVEQLPWEFTRNISERAKLGGESTSIAAIKKGYQAYLKQYGEEGLKKVYSESNDKYEKASQAYIDQEKEVERVKYSGMDKPEYKDAVKKLQILKNKKESALVDAVGNSIYQFIAGSSLRESLEVFMHRSTELERQLGNFDREGWDAKGGNKLVNRKALADIDNWNYLLNGIGRSHAALKNYSARFSFATGFMARLEAYAKEGVDISKPDKLLEIAHESYADWDRGKYQESNWISDKWNKLTTDIEKRNPEMAYLMRADVAITRVPVNMLYEGVMEYTLGGLTGSVIAAKEYYKARKIVLQTQFGPEEQASFKRELSDQLKKMDPKSAAAIVRAYRKQGFGMGMYALFILGHAAFGGFAHKGQTAEDKKKALREIETGNPEIKTGEIKLGDWKIPDVVAKIIEHTPGFQMPLLGLGLNQVYENSIIDGKSTPEAIKDGALAHINHIVNSIPQAELVGALASGIVQKVAPSGQWDDVDQEGKPMKRKVFRASDYFGYLHLPHTEGFKKDILSEAYYKAAVKTQKSYRDALTEVEINTSLSKQEKEEQRKELLKELDQEIEEIYKENKEDPQ